MSVALERLQAAFERLKEGKPERTKADGKISIKRINDEAGFSRGAIYHYKEFVIVAKADIALLKKQKDNVEQIGKSQSTVGDVERLRLERNNEKRIKIKYKNDLNEQKFITDEILVTNALLAHRIYELEGKLNKIDSQKVISIGRRK